MPTFHDPKQDADELGEAARGLAHASRTFDQPGDSYDVLGSLHYALTSVQQSLAQIGTFHRQHADRAATDDGNREAGREHAEKAAGWSQLAAASLHQVVDLVMCAQGESSRIAWHPDPATPEPGLSEALREREAALDPDAPETRQEPWAGPGLTR